MPGFAEMMVITMIMLIIPLSVFWIYALVDCAKNEIGPDQNRLIWILVIAMGGWIGAAVYWFVRRPQRLLQLGR